MKQIKTRTNELIQKKFIEFNEGRDSMMSETQRRPTNKKSHLEVTQDSEDEPYKEVEKKVDLNEIEPILTQN